MKHSELFTCPACLWEFTELSGYFYAWEVMGDSRTTVEVCEPCHRAHIEYTNNNTEGNK